MSPHPDLQIKLAPGSIDLSWGHPDPALLPFDEVRAAFDAAFRRNGGNMLPYGWMSGPSALIEWLMAHISASESRIAEYEQIVITAGNSWALDALVTHAIKPDDVVLVETPTYHYGVRMLRDRGNPLVAAPCDEDGIIIEALAERVRALKAEGARPGLLYCVPTFNNPTGRSLARERRVQLLELAAREGFIIAEDDVYRELAFDSNPPPSLWSMDTHGVVARMGSFSKSLAPGLRLGFITARRDLALRITHGGVLDSGGGIAHINGMMMAEFARDGGFERNARRLCDAYRERSTALAAALHEFMPQAKVTQPGGGFFTWLEMPADCDSDSLLPRVERAGTAYVPGARFFIEGDGARYLRLAHSYYTPANLREGVRRLADGLRG